MGDGWLTLDVSARAARQLAHRPRRPAHDTGDLLERDREHVVQHEREPLGGAEPVGRRWCPPTGVLISFNLQPPPRASHCQKAKPFGDEPSGPDRVLARNARRHDLATAALPPIACLV